MNLPQRIYIIGAGGVTSYFLPAFLKTVLAVRKKHPPAIEIIDGDNLEQRNLERQLFRPKAVTKNKAMALVKEYKSSYPELVAIDRYFHSGMQVDVRSLLFVFVDNHAARKAALEACDNYDCSAIIAANELTDSQAIWYDSRNAGTLLDPRERYPEILTDEEGDPRRPAGCNTEAALAAAPQLAFANFTCASHAMQLFWFYFFIRPKLDRETRPHWPIEHSNNFNKMITRTEEFYAVNNRAVEAR